VPLQACIDYTGKGEVVPRPRDEELLLPSRHQNSSHG
jgi:hypothetical protein